MNLTKRVRYASNERMDLNDKLAEDTLLDSTVDEYIRGMIEGSIDGRVLFGWRSTTVPGVNSGFVIVAEPGVAITRDGRVLIRNGSTALNYSMAANAVYYIHGYFSESTSDNDARRFYVGGSEISQNTDTRYTRTAGIHVVTTGYGTGVPTYSAFQASANIGGIIRQLIPLYSVSVDGTNTITRVDDWRPMFAPGVNGAGNNRYDNPNAPYLMTPDHPFNFTPTDTATLGIKNIRDALTAITDRLKNLKQTTNWYDNNFVNVILTGNIFKTVTNSYLQIFGGTSGNGASAILCGSAHPTNPSNMLLNAGYYYWRDAAGSTIFAQLTGAGNLGIGVAPTEKLEVDAASIGNWTLDVPAGYGGGSTPLISVKGDYQQSGAVTGHAAVFHGHGDGAAVEHDVYLASKSFGSFTGLPNTYYNFIGTRNGAVTSWINFNGGSYLQSSLYVGAQSPTGTERLYLYGTGSGRQLVIDAPFVEKSEIVFSSAGSPQMVFYRPISSTDLRVFSNTIGDMVYFQQATGNVGIGSNNNPTQLLHIEKSLTGAAREAIRVKNTDTSVSSNVAMQFYSGASGSLCSIGQAGSAYTGSPGYADFSFLVASGAGLRLSAYGASGIINFFAGNDSTERMRVTGGTITLDVYGKIAGGSYSSGAGDINGYSLELGGPAPTAVNNQATLHWHDWVTTPPGIAHQMRYTNGTLYLEADGSGYGTSAVPNLTVGGLVTGGDVGITTGSVGLYGATAVPAAAAVNGINADATNAASMGIYGLCGGTGKGIVGSCSNGTGVYGSAGSGDGVYGGATSGNGVYGLATSGVGVRGYSSTGIGVRGEYNGAAGQYGVYGTANNGGAGSAGVYGLGKNYGVAGQGGYVGVYGLVNVAGTFSAFQGVVSGGAIGVAWGAWLDGGGGAGKAPLHLVAYNYGGGTPAGVTVGDIWIELADNHIYCYINGARRRLDN